MVRFAKQLSLATLTAFLFCLGQYAIAAQSTPAAQTATPSSSATSTANNNPHGPMPAELTKSLDSKKLKPGDAVTGRITADLRMKDGTTIPRGSKLTGHVTEAKARSKGDPQSELGFTFDKLILPTGKELSIKTVLQAVAQGMQSNPQIDTSGPGMMAGHEQGAAGTTPPAMSSGTLNQPPSGPILNANSKGVLGVRNLQLSDNSVLTSTGKEVKLDSGAQLMLQVEIMIDPKVE